MVTAIELTDPPRRLRDVDLVERFAITPRLARDWLREMYNDGAIAKVGKLFFGDWPAVDAWVRSHVPRKRTQLRAVSP